MIKEIHETCGKALQPAWSGLDEPPSWKKLRWGPDIVLKFQCTKPTLKVEPICDKPSNVLRQKSDRKYHSVRYSYRFQIPILSWIYRNFGNVRRAKSISKARFIHGLLESPICADYRTLFVLEGNNPQRSDGFSNTRKSSRVTPTSALWIKQPAYQEQIVVFAK